MTAPMPPDSAMRRELKPCPMCGGKPTLVDDNSYGYATIECISCEADDVSVCAHGPTIELAAIIAKWNRRASQAQGAAWLQLIADKKTMTPTYDAAEVAWLLTRHVYAPLDMTPTFTAACDQIRALEAIVKEQRDALSTLLTKYVSLVDSGDCGNWESSTEAEVILARQALALTDKDAPHA